MPQKIPRIKAAEAIKAFQKADFYVARSSSSHYILKKEGHRLLLSIPVHSGRDLGVGLLAKQIENAGLTVDQFCELL